MDYIDHCAQQIQTLQKQNFVPQSHSQIARSETGGLLTNIGTYITSSGKEIYLALKTKTADEINNQNISSVANELAAYATINELYPALQPELPHIAGLVQHTTGQIVGLLLEDFSKNNTLHIKSISYFSQLHKPELFPQDFQQLLGEIEEKRKEEIGEDFASSLFFTTPSYEQPHNHIQRFIGDSSHAFYSIRKIKPEAFDIRFKHKKKIESNLATLSLTVDKRKVGEYERK